jgi:hypothetical protein
MRTLKAFATRETVFNIRTTTHFLQHPNQATRQKLQLSQHLDRIISTADKFIWAAVPWVRRMCLH